MSTPAGFLPELHQLHQQLQQVREKLDKGPKRIRAQENLLAQKTTERDTLKEKLIELRKSADGKSLQLKTNESKIQNLQGKLNAASNNKEYEIINTQIQADQMANSVLEDEILEALENVDQCQQQIKKAEASIEAQQQKVAEIKSEVETAKAPLEEQSATLSAAVTEKEKGLPLGMMDQYRRLVQAHGAECMTKIEGTTCTACYASLTAQERVNLNTGKIMFCRSCGRLAYSVDSR